MNEQKSRSGKTATAEDGQGETNEWKTPYKTFVMVSFCDAGRIRRCQVVFLDDERKLSGEMADFQSRHKDTGCGCRVCALEPEELEQVTKTLRDAQQAWGDMHESE